MTLDELRRRAKELGFVVMALGGEKYRVVLFGADDVFGPHCIGTIERCATWLDGWEARARFDGY